MATPFSISLSLAPTSTGTALRLAEPAVFAPLRLSHLEVDLPAIGEAGALLLARQQRRRGQLRALEIACPEDLLSTWLHGAIGQDLRGHGVERLHVRVGPTHLSLAARLLVHSHRVWLTARGRPMVADGAAPGDLTLSISAGRVYGFTPVPAPLCVLDLVRGLLGGLGQHSAAPGVGAPTIEIPSAEEIRVPAARLALWHLLPPAGYRLPSIPPDARFTVQLQDGRLLLGLSQPPQPRERDADPFAGSPAGDSQRLSPRDRDAVAAVERTLAAGDVRAAVDAYRALLRPPTLSAARRRLMSLLSTSPATFDEAYALAQAALQDSPTDPEALLTLGLIEATRGQPHSAAARYQALAALPGNTSEEVATAALVSAELLLSVSPSSPSGSSGAGAGGAFGVGGGADPPIPWLERAAAVPGGPASERAADHLREIYNQRGRWDALAQLEERLVSMAPASGLAVATPGAREEGQRRHLRLAALYLERLNDLERASAELERALSLSERNPAAWELRARLCLARRPPLLEDAVLALDRAADCSSPEAAAEIRTRAGALAERAEDHEGALLRYRQALQAVPDHTPALDQLADLLGRLDRLEEAKGAYESLLQRLPFGKNGDALRRQALLALSRIALNLEEDRPRARGYLGRALALGGDRDPEVLRAWADLEEQDGHLDKVDKALSRLEELGVTDSVLRRAEVLLQLQRPSDAAALAESVLTERPEQIQSVAALRMLARARQAMGDSRGLRETLERLCREVPDERRAHLELGRLLLLSGELPAAQGHLQQAGPEPAALHLLAELFNRQGDLPGLESALRGLIATLSESSTGARGSQSQRRAELALSLGRLAELLGRQGRAEEAALPLQRALGLLPSTEEAHLKIGDAALLLGRFPEARLAFAPLLQRDGSAADAAGPAGPAAPGAAALPASLIARLLSLAELGEAEHPHEACHCFSLALDRGAAGHEASRAWQGLIRLTDRAEPGVDPAAARDEKISVLLRAAEDPRTEESLGVRASLLRTAAELQREQGRLGEAAALYERSLDLDHGHLPALDALEELALQADDLPRLAEVLSRKARALASRPQDRKAVLGRLGRLYAEELHRRDLARDVFRQALALDPGFRPALVFLAEEAQERGDAGAELAHLKRLVSLPEVTDEPNMRRDRAELHARLAQLHRRAGRHEEAERQAQIALGLCPDHAGALALLEERYTATERLADLADILARRAEVEVNAVDRREALVRRARLLDQDLAQPDRALRAYHDLVRIAPDPESCVRLAALALLRESFEEIQDVAPVVGRALLRAGRGAEAIPILEYATAHGAGEPLFALLAEAYEEVGDYEHAADAWSAAAQAADPERHARALERAGRLEEALATWLSAAASEPQLQDRASREAAALCRRAMTQTPDAAADWARRLLEVAPGDVDALVMVARARPPQELPALLDLLGRRLTQAEAASTWLRAAQVLPTDLSAARRELLRRSLELIPQPHTHLLYSLALEGDEQRRALVQGLFRFPGDPSLVLALLRASDAAVGRAVLERTLASLEAASATPADEAAAARETILLGAADLLQEHGEIDEARQLLLRAGPSEAALRRRVRLDLDRLTDAAPGTPQDLLPVLQALYERDRADPGELLALLRLLTHRGQHADAAAVLSRAPFEVDEILSGLEESARYAELVDALCAHARVRGREARALYRRAADISEVHLNDLPRAAALLEQAAFCQGPKDDAAVLFSQAGALWNQVGDRERGASALGQALSAGGERTPGVLLALGDYCFDRSDWDAAARHYRRALAVDQVPQKERGRVRMRLAAIERRRRNVAAEEQELAAAVEAGAGATAWPALAALFRAQAEPPKLGAALLAWADHETGASRLALLQQAATLVTPSLLPRVDDELTKLDADDEVVRDRRKAWLRQLGDQHSLAQALVRDVDKSEGERRAAAARELAELCEQMGDPFAAASAWRVVLEATSEPHKDSQAVLAWLGRVREAGVELPAEVGVSLRGLLIQKGRLGDVVVQIDEQLKALPDDTPPEQERLRQDLLREAAELVESLGDHEDAAARWLHLAGRYPQEPTHLFRARHLLRLLADTHRTDVALEICEREMARLAGRGPVPSSLRVVHAEVLAHLQRTEESIGELELLLLRDPDQSLVHVLLGMLLGQSPSGADTERGLLHLLRASAAEDIEPQDAGECALLAAELLLGGVRPPAESGPSPDAQALLLRAADLLAQDRRPLEILLRVEQDAARLAPDPDGAQAHLSRAILFVERLLDLSTEPAERARLLLAEGRLLLDLSRLSEAELALQEALALAPETPEILAALRALHLQRGEAADLAKAEDLCRREMAETAAEARQAELYLELGEILDRRGDSQGALEAYRSAGELGALRGFEELSRRLSDLNEWGEAADAAGELAAKLPPTEQGQGYLWAAELAVRGGDEARARQFLEQAADVPPGSTTPAPVWGLADLCYRNAQYARARALYDSCGDALPEDAPDAAEILRRRAELADLAADGLGAEVLYGRLLSLLTGPGASAETSAAVNDPAAFAATEDGARLITRAAEELTRLSEQRGDYAAAQKALTQLLPYLPAADDAAGVERRAQVRLHLSWLAHQQGDLPETRRQLQHVLAERPAHREGLQLLLNVHRQAHEPLQAAEVLDRLISLAEDPAERADLLFERASLCETQFDEPARALELFQQAVDALPGHVPSLRRMIACHLRDASGIGAAEAVRELEEAGQPLLEAQIAGGLGLALAGDDEGADRLLRGVGADELAAGLCLIGLPAPGDLTLLDEAIAAAMRSLGGSAALPGLVAALRARLSDSRDERDLGARQVLGRLSELREEPAARLHLAVLSYLLPGGYAAAQLDVLGPLPPAVAPADLMPAAGRGPLRDALEVLGRHVLGLPTAPLPLSPEVGLRLRPLAHAMGFPRLDVAVVDELPGDECGRCDPSRPPRLRLPRRVAAAEGGAQARFAALRALHLLLLGVPLVHARGAEDIAGLLRATARLLGLPPAPIPEVQDPLGESWAAELASLGISRDTFLPEERAALESALRLCQDVLLQPPDALQTALPLFLLAAERAAERHALLKTGDLRAALLSLAPPPAAPPATEPAQAPLDGPRAVRDRLEALRRGPAAELIAFADQHYL